MGIIDFLQPWTMSKVAAMWGGPKLQVFYMCFFPCFEFESILHFDSRYIKSFEFNKESRI